MPRGSLWKLDGACFEHLFRENMNIIATIFLALVVIVAALLFVASSLCTVSGGLNPSGRIIGGVLALCCLGVMSGGTLLIAKIHRKP